METKSARPFGLLDKIGYAMGDFGNNFTFIFASMYLMTFCTDVLGMVPAVVAASATCQSRPKTAASAPGSSAWPSPWASAAC